MEHSGEILGTAQIEQCCAQGDCTHTTTRWARGGRSSVTYVVYRWMECAAPMTRLLHFPCYCGGLR